jgi:2-beta-glucuronyltransferase
MKRVVFVTSHYWDSRRKAGFHWLADAFWRAGWDVLFFTESISWLSWLRRDRRFSYPIFREANKLRAIRERMASYVWLTPFHPVNLRNGFLNRLSAPLLSFYGQFPAGEAEPKIAQADLFVFDSDHGLFLFDRFKKCNPRARFVYRVSDDIPMMGHHPMVLQNEERLVAQFDLLSVPCDYLYRRFSHLPHVILQKHGLRKELFDAPSVNPYRGQGPFLVYVGMDYFDHDFLQRALRVFPQGSFHVFGSIANLPTAANLHAYGECPFVEIVPYLKHADVGLQARSYCPGAECLTDSLKMHQYTYCRLPIVAPLFLKHERPHVSYYEPGNDASIRAALLAAQGYDRASISTAGVLTWDELALKLAA